MPRLRRLLLAAVIVPPSLTGAMLASERLLERAVTRDLQARGIAVESVTADLFSGRLVATGLAASHGVGDMRIGRLSLAGLGLVAPALAADPAVLQDVTFTWGTSVRFSLPRIEVTGSDLSRDALAGLLSGSADSPAAARLSRLNAATIAIPEATYVQTVGDRSETTTYRGIVARNVVNGRIGRLEGAGGAMTSTLKSARTYEGTYGAWSVDSLDLPLSVRLYVDTARPDEKPAPVYANYRMAEVALKTADGQDVRFEAFRSDGLTAMPGAKPMLATVEAMQGAEGKSDDEKLAISMDLLDQFRAYTLGQTEVIGLIVNGTDNGKTFAMNIRRLGFSVDAAINLSIEGTTIEGPQAKVAIGAMTLKDVFLSDAFASLGTVAVGPAAAAKIDPASFIPRFSRFEISGFSAEAPDAAQPERRNRLDLRQFAVDAWGHAGPVPTGLAVRFDNLKVEGLERSQNENVRRLVAMGYRAIDVSLRLDAAWDEAKKELSIRELTAEGADMGTMRVSGTLGDVDKDVFSTDPTVAQIAAMAATARKLAVEVEDRGLFNRWLADHARQVKRKPDELRVEYGGAAIALVPAILGPGEGARAAGAAIGRFIARPGKLSLSAATKDGIGLGLADLALVSDPAAIGRRLDITARAE